MGGLRGRLRQAFVVAALVLALPAPVGASTAAPPKVAIIVGPVGPSVTTRYRSAADAAAAVAGTLTPNVVTVYSPDATWPAVEAAVTGASVVVYLGHGNGWPSRYSESLVPRSQDGFGLNPAAGIDDTAHQYFGEAYVSKLRLAPGATVLLSHLCYASGSTEPGLPDGSFDQVRARVDNFAAGFLAAGASTVIAEGHADPAALIAAAIAGPAAVRAAWSRAAWGHGHAASYSSVRTPGAASTLDPDTLAADGTGSGWYRAMTIASGTMPEVASPAPVVAPVPSLASAGVAFGPGSVSAPIMPGAPLAISMPVSGKGVAAIPSALAVGIRLLPLGPSSPTDGALTSADGLVVGDATGDLVSVAQATVSQGGLVIHAPAPTQPGEYLALLTLEASDGTPYDAATQALLRPVVLRVPPPVEATITAPATLAANAGQPLTVAVSVANTGTQAWGSPLYADLWSDPSPQPWLATLLGSELSLRASWVNGDTGASSLGESAPLPPAVAAVGGSAQVVLGLTLPPTAGRWLLVLSVAAQGSMGDFPTDTLVVPVEVQ